MWIGPFVKNSSNPKTCVWMGTLLGGGGTSSPTAKLACECDSLKTKKTCIIVGKTENVSVKRGKVESSLP